MSAADDLSGGWDGIYNYPRVMRPTPFTATLRDSAGLLVGETSEPGDHGSMRHALLDGSREGNAIRFIKTYDDTAGGYRSVSYSGTVNGEGTEISGRWDIPGVWSGTFIMVRHVGEEEVAETRVVETVR
ncbi:hypothetical protein U1839_07680 [Sphingomonas sp. RT2P30]|uniref:hypothetical protein n=1 Tax=Parasphingomonas halimpatiens TaxID=3096162 RepID=UPI002FCAB829